jgi:hypothetical protein
VAGLNDVSFVPDADIASVTPYAAVEINPCRPVFLILRSRIGFQVLEGALILHDYAPKTAMPQKSGFGMSFEFLQHFRYGEENGKPFMQFPRFIDSYADEKDHELAFHLGRHAGTNYLCHKTSSVPELLIWDAAQRIIRFPRLRLNEFATSGCPGKIVEFLRPIPEKRCQLNRSMQHPSNLLMR